ncbi:xaa-Pro aminopeptidase 3-like [Planococcus citri]|uniref:xaa-Pro aminopeptidase 3-like n=1 Tax=Planococcus citri TaxID=170843 RepID=UPI0031FA3700
MYYSHSSRLRCSFVLQIPRISRLCTNVENKLKNTPTPRPVKSRKIPIFPPSFGQPTSHTHPHLLKNRELLPGMEPEEFADRRRNLMQILCAEALSIYEQNKHHIIIIPSATKTYMTEKIPYFFRQNTDFLYLTGCLEPDTALILTGSCEDDLTSTLFVRKQDAHSALWDGPRTGIDVAPKMFAVDQALHVDNIQDFLKRNLQENPDSLVYYDSNSSPSSPLHQTLSNLLKVENFKIYQTVTFYLHSLRAIKSPAEQNLMRKAGEISAEAIKETIRITKPGMTEHQLFSTVDHECRMLGAEFLAYPPVVAAGDKATIIHYIDNNQMLKDGDLILMDAGCEYRGYCGDITRTWPANGKFTNYQRILYEIVLEVQKKILSLCDDRASLDVMYIKMVRLLGEHLSKEKIIKKDVASPSEINKIASDLCPHRVSHYLGMDVHDVASYPKNLPLQPGMIVTVEPGLYVREHDENVPPEFWRTGIRIEDDVLITETGYEVLSAKCPKEVDDIENLMKTSS